MMSSRFIMAFPSVIVAFAFSRSDQPNLAVGLSPRLNSVDRYATKKAAEPRRIMMNKFLLVTFLMAAFSILSSAQTRIPSTPTKPYVVKTGQQVANIYKDLAKQDGNKQFDVFPAPGTQMRVAVFHDEKRVDDLFEVHDA